MTRMPKLKKVTWSSRDGEFKVKETEKTFYDGKEYTIERGTLRFNNQYYRVTKRVGEGIRRAQQELNMKVKMGMITPEQYTQEINRIQSDLETKRVNAGEGARGFDIGRTNVFFENLMQKAGISDKLFSKENRAMMSDEQKRIVTQFKRNMNQIRNSPLKQQALYDEISEYYKDVKGFYKLMKEQGGELTKDQIDAMVGTIDNINKKYSKLKQTKLDKYDGSEKPNKKKVIEERPFEETFEVVNNIQYAGLELRKLRKNGGRK